MSSHLIVAVTPSRGQNGTRLSEIALRLNAAHAQYRELHESLHAICRRSLPADWCTTVPCVLTTHALMQTALYHVRVLEQMAREMRG